MPASTATIAWFRQDLRLADNPALSAAVARGGPVLPLFILDESGDWAPGGASRWWLHHSLEALAADLPKAGAPLCLRRGKAEEILPELVKRTDAGAVFWNRCYEPAAVARDKRLKKKLTEEGVDVASFNGALLAKPWELTTGKGEPYKVFTPFWKALRASGARRTNSPAFSTRRQSTTRRTATARTAPAPRGCRRTCTGARSRRARSGRRRSTPLPGAS